MLRLHFEDLGSNLAGVLELQVDSGKMHQRPVAATTRPSPNWSKT